MRRYETVFILRPALGESQISDTVRRFEGIIGNNGGELIESDHWGNRELAYPIARERRGYYIRLDYVGSGPVMNELERNLKLADDVLRYLSVLVQEEADAAVLREEIEARKRRQAEAKAPAEPPAQAAAHEEPPAQAATEEAPPPAPAPDAPAEAGEAPAEAQGDTSES